MSAVLFVLGCWFLLAACAITIALMNERGRR